MLKKIITIILSLSFLTSCSLVHKSNIEQGNYFECTEVSRLKIGMHESQVKAILGNPVFVNIFTPSRFDYVYTFKTGNNPMIIKKVTCFFKRGQLTSIETA